MSPLTREYGAQCEEKLKAVHKSVDFSADRICRFAILAWQLALLMARFRRLAHARTDAQENIWLWNAENASPSA
jgi:hypothetical protein